jgi:hypothetical protein
VDSVTDANPFGDADADQYADAFADGDPAAARNP